MDRDELFWSELEKVRSRLHELRGIDATVGGHTILMGELARRQGDLEHRVDGLESVRDMAKGAAQEQAKIYSRSVALVGIGMVMVQVLVAVLLR